MVYGRTSQVIAFKAMLHLRRGTHGQRAADDVQHMHDSMRTDRKRTHLATLEIIMGCMSLMPITTSNPGWPNPVHSLLGVLMWGTSSDCLHIRAKRGGGNTGGGKCGGVQSFVQFSKRKTTRMGVSPRCCEPLCGAPQVIACTYRHKEAGAT